MKSIFKTLIFILSLSLLSSCSIVDDDFAGAFSTNSGTAALSKSGARRQTKALVTATIRNLNADNDSGDTRSKKGRRITGGSFTKFSFSKGKVTQSETNWDIAFRDTTIIVNGGSTTGFDNEPSRNGNAAVVIVNDTFDNVTTAPTDSEFLQDGDGSGTHPTAITTGSGNGWYTYDFWPWHEISPIPGKTLVFRTRDGKHYAKVQILSYYEDAPETIGFSNFLTYRYYTFKYTYNPNIKSKTFNSQ